MQNATNRPAAGDMRALEAHEVNIVAGGAENNGAFLIQQMMSSLKLMGEILSNVSKTRSEISMTFARNSRA
jgi:hypothetical protein